MDKMRRLAYGRLSEIYGDETIELDHFMRGLNLHGQSKKWADDMRNGNHTKEEIEEKFDLLQYYVVGINMFKNY